MRPTRFGIALTAVAAIAALSCAGDGTGLDEFGNPMGQSPPELAPTLSSVQANIFSPICTQCHTGTVGPLGLVLDEGVARANLVGVASVEVPELMRVKAGEPDSSYIVWKIEGRAGIVGEQMPLALPPLSAEQVAAIRGWIANGALDD
jgi:hypothetical protein